MLKTFKKISFVVLAMLLVLGVREWNKRYYNSHTPPTHEKTLNVLSWDGYMRPHIIKAFEKKYGVKVKIDLVDSDEALEAKVLSGHVGYDVIVSSTPYIPEHIKLGAYKKISPAEIPQLKNFDRKILGFVNPDPAKEVFAVPLMWGTTGIAYNPAVMEKHLPNEEIDSWAYLFSEEKLKKLAPHGVAYFRSSTELFDAAKIYFGYDVHNTDPKVIDDITKKLEPLLKYIKVFLTYEQVEHGLLSNEIALAQAWSIVRVSEIGDENSNYNVKYIIPKEGSLGWIDCLVITEESPKTDLALQFINHIVEPKNLADLSNYSMTAVANNAAKPFVDKKLLNDPSIYCDEATMKLLKISKVGNLHYKRYKNKNFFKLMVGH